MKDLKEYLNESLNESIDIQSAEKIIYDVLAKSASVFRADVDDDQIREYANMIVDLYDDEGSLRKHNRSDFERWLRSDGFFNILSAADALMADGEIEMKEHDAIYQILGQDD